MALISCSECSKQISDKAAACPNCGCPIAQSIEEQQYKDIQQIAEECDYDKTRIMTTLINISKKIYGNLDYYNMLMAFKIIDKAINDKNFHYDIRIIRQCVTCKKHVPIGNNSCPYCGTFKEKLCSKCHSSNIEKISGFSKGVSVSLFGAFATNTVLNTYRCKKCGEKFK